MAGEPTYRIPGQTSRVACLGAECAYRPCLWLAPPARKGEPPRCGRRDQTGCPTPIPPLDPERVRCCVAPDFPPPGGARAVKSKCRTCGRFAEGTVLGLRRMLARTHEPVACGHVPPAGSVVWRGAHPIEGESAMWSCDLCRGWWDHEPKPFERGEEVEAFRLRAHRAWLKVHGLEETTDGMERFAAAVREGYGAQKPHPKVTAAQERAARRAAQGPT